MRRRDPLPVTFLALILAAGCSVPVRPGLDRDVRRLEESYKAASELAESDPKAALPHLERVERSARELARTFMIGDPRREMIDKVLAEAASARKRIEKALREDPDARLERALARQAQSAVEDGKESKEEVRGRPTTDLSIVDSAIGAARRSGASGRAVSRDADADFDRPGMAHRRGGERKGDIDLSKEFAKKEKAAAPKPRPRYTQPVTVQRVVAKRRSVVVYVVFLSQGSTSQVASVTGDILDEKGEIIGKIMGAYLAKGFEPNWDDIYSSSGKWITPESAVMAEADKPLFLAAVTQLPKAGQLASGSAGARLKAGKPKAAKVTITTAGGRHPRGRGP